MRFVPIAERCARVVALVVELVARVEDQGAVGEQCVAVRVGKLETVWNVS
jgi:hypothetical protein